MPDVMYNVQLQMNSSTIMIYRENQVPNCIANRLMLNCPRKILCALRTVSLNFATFPSESFFMCKHASGRYPALVFATMEPRSMRLNWSDELKSRKDEIVFSVAVQPAC